MFGRKKDDTEDDTEDDMDETGENSESTSAVPLQTSSGGGSSSSTRVPVNRPEIVRHAPDIHGGGRRRSERLSGSAEDGKTLTVGREIALNGEINSCDKLVVEGRVEANMKDCREIEVAESGTFKGQAEIDFAEISGVFEGSLTARQLLVVRATGKITGTVRFGELEIERGGEIVGDVQVYEPSHNSEDAASFAAKGPAE